jgi:hypothetical protein
MAGRQFSFFLGPNDQLAFEEVLRSSGDIAFFSENSMSNEPELYATVQIGPSGEDSFKILIARKADLKKIEFIPSKGPNGAYANQDVSPFVEFSRFPAVVDGRMIRASRLYRIDKYWGDDGKLVSKSPEFIDWADRLYKLAKASLTKVEQGCYAGAEALELRKAGVAFEGLDIEIGSVEG